MTLPHFPPIESLHNPSFLKPMCSHHVTLLRYKPLRPQPIFNFNRKGQQPQRRDDEVNPNIVTDLSFVSHTVRAVSCRVGRCIHCLSFHVSLSQTQVFFGLFNDAAGRTLAQLQVVLTSSGKAGVHSSPPSRSTRSSL